MDDENKREREDDHVPQAKKIKHDSSQLAKVSTVIRSAANSNDNELLQQATKLEQELCKHKLQEYCHNLSKFLDLAKSKTNDGAYTKLLRKEILALKEKLEGTYANKRIVKDLHDFNSNQRLEKFLATKNANVVVEQAQQSHSRAPAPAQSLTPLVSTPAVSFRPSFIGTCKACNTQKNSKLYRCCVCAQMNVDKFIHESCMDASKEYLILKEGQCDFICNKHPWVCWLNKQKLTFFISI